MQPPITILSGATTSPFLVNPDGWVVIEPGSGATVTVQYTLGTSQDIAAGIAVYVTHNSFTRNAAVRVEEDLQELWFTLSVSGGNTTYHVEGEISRNDRFILRGYTKEIANGLGVTSITNPVTGGLVISAGSRFIGFPSAVDMTPRVMATPPTVAITNNTAGSVSVTTPKTLPGQSYTSILCNDLNSYLPLGTGETAPVIGNGTLGAYTATWPISSVGATQIVRPSFTFDGSVFSFTVRQFTSVQFRIMVDGEYATQYPVALGGASNSYGEVKVTFASRAMRKITIELCGTDDLFLGVSYQVNDSMQAISAPKRRLVVAGDSYAGGSGTSAIGTFVSYMAQSLGFQDFVNAGVGSTGWLANGSYTNIGTRLATDVIAHKPTDVIFTLGHNDTGFTNAAITTQVQTVLARTRAALPNLINLIVTGPLFANGTPGVYTAMNAAIQAGCVASGVTFIDTVANPIFTGTGYAGAPTGVGNADLYIAADSTHPNDGGSTWLGHQLAQRIRKVTY